MQIFYDKFRNAISFVRFTIENPRPITVAAWAGLTVVTV